MRIFSSARLVALFAVTLTAATTLFPHNAYSITDSAKEYDRLKKAGVNVTKCPKFIAKLSSGLFTSINPSNTICLNGTRNKKAVKLLKSYKRVAFIYDGVLRGNPFLPVVGQEGDVNTDPFTEVNYPVAINFDMTNAEYTATYRISVMNGENGRTLTTAIHGHVPASGWVDWIGSGRFFFNISAKPDKDANQPTFDVSMEYMEQYEGFPVSKADIKDAGVKLVPCPAQLDDFYGKQLYSTKGFVCSNQDAFEDAGFTPAPFNLRTGLFLAQDISPDVMDGAGQGFPFRILKPTTLTYSVDDPAVADGKKGSVEFSLYNLSSGKQTRLAAVQGSISATTTYINLPGDYAVLVKPHPSDPTKYGDIEWQINVEGSK